MRIVMIEDEARIASFVKSGLESEGFLVEHADDGAAGLELVLDTDPDLVILDLILPRMGGEEVLGRLRGALGIRSVRPVAPAIVGLHALERHAATGEADGHHAGLTGGEAVAARRQSGGQRLRRPAGRRHGRRRGSRCGGATDFHAPGAERPESGAAEQEDAGERQQQQSSQIHRAQHGAPG